MATGHGGSDCVMKHLLSKYANITRDAVELFKYFCVLCQEKRRHGLELFAGQSVLNKERLASTTSETSTHTDFRDT